MSPTKAADPKPDVSARCRLNTPTCAVFWNVTNAYRPSGVMATASACFWSGVVSDPIGLAPDCCSRELTWKTVSPLPPVTAR